MDKKFIKTEFGKLDINKVPIIDVETTEDKILKCVIFFGFIITSIIIILYLSNCNQPNYARLKINPIMESMYGSIKATSIKLYNMGFALPLRHVIIKTTDGNIIDFNTYNGDLKSQMAVTKYNYFGTTIFLINFRDEFDIESIDLISDQKKYINHITIDLLYIDMPVWHFSGNLYPQIVNKIMITKQFIDPPVRGAIPETPLLERSDLPHKKLIINEDSLAIQLSEDGEDNYISHSMPIAIGKK